MNEIIIRAGRGRHLIWMVDSRQSPKFRFDLSFSRSMWNAKILVEIARSSDLPVCFVDCVEEVGAHDYDVDAPSVADKFRGARLRFGITGSDSRGIPDVLHPSCDQLKRSVSKDFWICLFQVGRPTFGRKVQPARESN